MNDFEKYNISENIKYLRKLNKEKNRVLADSIFVSEKTIEACISKRNVSEEVLRSIANHYAVPFHNFIRSDLEFENVKPAFEKKLIDPDTIWLVNELKFYYFEIPEKVMDIFPDLRRAQELCASISNKNSIEKNIKMEEEALDLFIKYDDNWLENNELLENEYDDAMIPANIIWVIQYIYRDMIALGYKELKGNSHLCEGYITNKDMLDYTECINYCIDLIIEQLPVYFKHT